MGSKRWMLQNGLTDVIRTRVPDYRRFVDLFCGSGIVSWHVAQNYRIPVLANDLQEFCRALAASIVCRTETLGRDWIDTWISDGASAAHDEPLFSAARRLELAGGSMALTKFAADARDLCETANTPIAAAYGGHYYSPVQAIYLDCLRSLLPTHLPHRLAALGALIQTASSCAASPGHTAQPFRPTTTAGPYLRHSWSRDVLEHARRGAERLSVSGAQVPGSAVTGDANALASQLNEGDLVFVDPPCSSVHYSRFYHVLETIAVGENVTVSGTGRYPPRKLRPRSRYSLTSESQLAFQQLLTTIAHRKCGVLMTFPAGLASNGLSGVRVVEIARELFMIDRVTIKSRFSTLGGNRRNRAAMMNSEELLLSLVPK